MTFYLFWYGNAWIDINMDVAAIEPYLRAIISPLVCGFLLLNIWTSVLIGLNRYLTVCRPIRARTLCTVDNARRQFVGVICCSIVYMIPKFLEYKLVTTDDGVNYEKRLARSKWFIYIYTVGCEGIFRFLIPCSLLIIIFVCLIRVLCTRRRPLDFPEGRPMDNRLTALVTVVMGVILGCTVPHGILIVTEVYRFRGDSERIKVVTEDVVDYAFPVLSCLIILNSSVNFLFHIVCMKEFRRISCKRCVAEEQSVEWDEISYSSQNPNGAAETAFLT